MGRKFQVWENESSVHKDTLEGDPKQHCCKPWLFGCISMIEFNEQDCQIPARVGEKAQVTVSIKRLYGASGRGTGYTEWSVHSFLAPF